MNLNYAIHKNILYRGVLCGILFSCGGSSITYQVIAEETTGEKIENKTDDLKTDTKVNYRKTKKKIRDATGNSDKGKDFGDSLRNAGDKTKDTAKKIKRKVD